MDIDAGTHLDLFDFLGFLVFPRSVGFFLLLVLELTVIENLAYGRFRVRRDLDKIKPSLIREIPRLADCYDTVVFTISSDQAYLFDTDLIVDARPFLFGRSRKLPFTYGRFSYRS
jgi:hypothetical protein